ncbi:MAG: rod shape-determining protein RodA [Alphaproteobacteria bacterium]|nr:rod shape-determining protein RodA [Alphaproteobacteria bacterium]
MAILLNQNQDFTLKERFLNLNFTFIFIICLLAITGCLILYSAAGGNINPWALNHGIRFLIGLFVLLITSIFKPAFYYKTATPFYFLTLMLLIVVDVAGYTGMGAKRWIDLGFIKLQPSELMKIAIVLQLSKFFSTTALEDIRTIKGLIPPILYTAVPVAFILIQPDLGTSLMILFTATALFYLAGVEWYKFIALISALIVSAPILWHKLHTYQQNRILTFLNPERDPQGAGYHIIQAKIALGSGGLTGKGFLSGTQSHLNFLPEKHTDFIFTMFSEEFGMLGGVFILVLNLILISYGYWFAFRIHPSNYFGKLVILGLNTNYFLYIFINIAMVIGLLPVVGVPLPLISYGGTVIISVMASFGIMMSFYINRDKEFKK